jgi:hypothetical protein
MRRSTPSFEACADAIAGTINKPAARMAGSNFFALINISFVKEMYKL